MPTRLTRFAANLSVKQTAALCLCGGLMSGGAHFTTYLVHFAKPHQSENGIALWTVVTLGLWLCWFFGGLAIAFYAYSQLQNGIAAARWPDEEIESLRTLLRSRLILWCSVVLLLAFAASIWLPHKYGSYGWACLLLGQSLNWINLSTRRPPSLDPPQPTWTNLAPIQSEHWGNR